jgi:hypothetical protein
MAIHRPCSHGKTLCGIYSNVRSFAHKADNFIKDYGEPIGQVAQGIAPAITAAYPVAGLVTGAVGKGLEVYSQVANDMN